jgi:hypothetical protein
MMNWADARIISGSHLRTARLYAVGAREPSRGISVRGRRGERTNGTGLSEASAGARPGRGGRVRLCLSLRATVAIDTFMTELSSVIRNWPAASVSSTT